MFRPERFARLARAHFAEHWRGYAWFLAAGVLIEVIVSIVIAMGKRGMAEYTTDAQLAYYFLGLFVFAPIFAGRYFQSMSQRAPALLALMRPASTFEKWLLAVLVVLLLYPLAYTFGYYLVAIPDALLAAQQAQQESAQAALVFAGHPVGVRPDPFDPKNYRIFLLWRELDEWRDALAIALWLLLIQGFAMFGSLYFRSVPFIKTLLAALVFALLVSLFSTFNEGSPDIVLGYWSSTRTLSEAQRWGYGLLWFLVPAMLWLACYRALREREIAA